MKKILIGLAVFSIVALSFGAASYAYAQGGSNPWGGSHNPGMMGSSYGGYSDYDHDMMSSDFGHGMIGDEDGPMHDAMIASLASALGLTIDELEARHDAGETHWEIAEALGLSESDIQAIMFTAHEEAMAQEGADWMLSHMGEGTFGSGSCDGSAGGFQGHGMNWDTNTGARP